MSRVFTFADHTPTCVIADPEKNTHFQLFASSGSFKEMNLNSFHHRRPKREMRANNVCQ